MVDPVLVQAVLDAPVVIVVRDVSTAFNSEWQVDAGTFPEDEADETARQLELGKRALRAVDALCRSGQVVQREDWDEFHAILDELRGGK